MRVLYSMGSCRKPKPGRPIQLKDMWSAPPGWRGGWGIGTGRLVSMHVEKFKPALRLYERLGYQIAGDRGVY